MNVKNETPNNCGLEIWLTVSGLASYKRGSLNGICAWYCKSREMKVAPLKALNATRVSLTTTLKTTIPEEYLLAALMLYVSNIRYAHLVLRRPWTIFNRKLAAQRKGAPAQEDECFQDHFLCIALFPLYCGLDYSPLILCQFKPCQTPAILHKILARNPTSTQGFQLKTYTRIRAEGLCFRESSLR